MKIEVYKELADARHDVCIIQENIELLKKTLKHLIDLEHFMEDNNLDSLGETTLKELRNSISNTNKCYKTNKDYYKHYSLKVSKLKLDVKDINREYQILVVDNKEN